MTPREHRRAMSKHLQSLTGAYRLWNVFEAWAECAALALANSTTLPGTPRHAEREQRYQKLISTDPARAAVYPQILAHLVAALDLELHDALGALFHENDLQSSGMGQFFTPYEVSKVMAGMTLGSEDTFRAEIDRKGFITLCEPASGAGGMVIAIADAMLERDLNPQQHLHVTATDLDRTAAHMTFIQLSLLGIPAVVHVGNSLSLEVFETFVTPAHVLGGWRWRLRAHDRGDRTPAPLIDDVVPALLAGPPADRAIAQPSLFGELVGDAT